MKKFLLFPVACVCTLMIQAQRRQVEQAIQKKYYDKYGKEGEDNLNAWLGGNLGNVTPEDAYKFPVSVTQHITTYNKGKVKDEADMTYYLNMDHLQFAMDGNQMSNSKSKKKSSSQIITVYDIDKSALLMYNVSDKTLFAMNMNAFRSKASQEAAKKQPKSPKDSDVSCSKSGKTKTILGHSCYEYVCKKEGDDSYTAMWINSEIKIPEVPYMMGGVPGLMGKSNGIVGTVLGIDSYNEGELASRMEVTEINEKADLLIKTADYKVQSMPTMNFGN